jgi:hypothetical protein
MRAGRAAAPYESVITEFPFFTFCTPTCAHLIALP